MNIQSFSKIWILIILVVLITGGFLVWQSWDIIKFKLRPGMPMQEATPHVPKSCAKNEDCGKDTCQQGREKCVEIKHVCELGKCVFPAKTVEFPSPPYKCFENKCQRETMEETSDWKIYKNEEYGFEIKYSNNYYIKVSGKREEGGLIYDLLRVDIDKEPLSDHRTPLVAINVAGPNFVLGTRDWEDFFLGEIDGSISYNWENWKVREKVSSAEIIFTSENNQTFYVITQNDPLENKVIYQILSTFRFLE